MLRGNLQDFGLADILQLIVKGQKSGVFVVRSPSDEVHVTFNEGWVFDVTADSRPNDSKLGSRLVRAGLLSHAALGQTLKRRAETGVPLARLIVEGGHASEEVVMAHATLIASDTLFEIFTWRAGTYEFHDGVMPRPATIEPLAGEQLLMQGIVLTDEWPNIEARVPSPLCFVERRWALPPEQTLDDAPLFASAAPGEPEIGPEEREIHGLCVPGTEVQAVIDRASVHRYEVLRCLSVLVGAHYVRLAEPTDD
jgi:hypothetical protein